MIAMTGKITNNLQLPKKSYTKWGEKKKITVLDTLVSREKKS